MMYGISNIQKIYVCLKKVDFRKGHDGLMGEARIFNLSPYRGDVIAFISRCRTKIKILSSDKTGTCLGYKRFEAGNLKTTFRFIEDRFCNEISQAELAMLIEGTDFNVTKKAKEWKPK